MRSESPVVRGLRRLDLAACGAGGRGSYSDETCAFAVTRSCPRALPIDGERGTVSRMCQESKALVSPPSGSCWREECDGAGGVAPVPCQQKCH